jgi:hypothetical protein
MNVLVIKDSEEPDMKFIDDKGHLATLEVIDDNAVLEFYKDPIDFETSDTFDAPYESEMFRKEFDADALPTVAEVCIEAFNEEPANVTTLECAEYDFMDRVIRIWCDHQRKIKVEANSAYSAIFGNIRTLVRAGYLSKEAASACFNDLATGPK